MTFLTIRFLLLVAPLAISCATPALAFNEPDSFRGVPWGSDRRGALSILEKGGETPKCDVPRYCRSNSVVIGSVNTMILYQFSQSDLFEGAILTFSPTGYATLRAIFSERYGQPSNARQETLQNRMGATFTNEIALWDGEKVVVDLRKYGSKIDQGRAAITLKTVFDQHKQDRERAIKKGKGDL